MREDAGPPVLEPERGINNIYETRIAGNEGWNPQGPCPPMRWMADEAASIMHGCMIVYDDHVTGSRVRSLCNVGIMIQPGFWLLLGMEGELVTRASWA